MLVLCTYILQYSQDVECVVVDGDKKKDISATKKQSLEQGSIDEFNTKTCGMSDPNYDEHEFVNMAKEGQFPWIASFQIKVPRNESRDTQKKVADKSVKKVQALTGKRIIDLHFCCGSFISDRWILSAAHCFAVDSIKTYLKTNKLKVVAGSHKVSSRALINRNLTIKRIYYHASFDKSMPVGHDIALVELNEKVEFAQKRPKSDLGEQNKPFMNTICLPKTGKKYKFNETARLAGWGLSNEKDPSSMPSKLLTTDILVSDKDKCVKKYEKALKSDRPRKQQEKYDDFICASYKNSRDACQSDSGGPLMQYSNNKAVVVGIVSYGIGCAKKGVPGLYTRTSAYISWIKDITKNGPRASVAFNLLEAEFDSPKKSSTTTHRPKPNVSRKNSKTTSSKESKKTKEVRDSKSVVEKKDKKAHPFEFIAK